MNARSARADMNRETARAVLELLSATELAEVYDDANAQRKLAVGEEYLDLERPVEGAKRSTEGRLPTGRVLPRRAVDGGTWQSILGVVAARRSRRPI